MCLRKNCFNSNRYKFCRNHAKFHSYLLVSFTYIGTFCRKTNLQIFILKKKKGKHFHSFIFRFREDLTKFQNENKNKNPEKSTSGIYWAYGIGRFFRRGFHFCYARWTGHQLSIFRAGKARHVFFIQGLESFYSSTGQEGTFQTPVWCLAHIPDKEEW